MGPSLQPWAGVHLSACLPGSRRAGATLCFDDVYPPPSPSRSARSCVPSWWRHWRITDSSFAVKRPMRAHTRFLAPKRPYVFVLFLHFRQLSGKQPGPIKDQRTAHAARHPRFCRPLRRAHAVGCAVPLTGCRRQAAVPDAWRQGQRRTAPEPQRLETWCVLGPVQRHGARGAENQRPAARDPPDPARSGGGRTHGNPCGPAARRGRNRARRDAPLGAKNKKTGEQPHAPGFFPVRARLRTDHAQARARLRTDLDGHEKGAEP